MKYVFYDTEGHGYLEVTYDEIVDFENDVLSVRQSNKWRLIDRDGKEITPFVNARILRYER